MTLIALTGGIGAGKTTLASQFKALGAATADADDIAHSAYQPGNNAYNSMLRRWGDSVLHDDGQINRKAVASIVFKDAGELAWLNGVVHPFVRSEINRLAADKLLFCAIPLLDEAGWSEDCAAVVAAWCPPDVQRQRLRERGWSEDEIDRRLSKQVSMNDKLLHADYGVVTSCSWDCLARQCRKIYELIISGQNKELAQ